MSGTRGRRGIRTAMVAVVVLALAACTDGDKPPPAPVTSGAASSAPTPTPGRPLSLTVSPTTGKKEVPVSVEIGTAVTGGRVSAVVLREPGGKAVAGALRDDGSAWVPAKPLKTSQRYEATVTAVDAGGTATTATTTFTTMGAATRHTGTGLYLFDGNTYGVAMPVVVEFSPPVPERDRAGVQRRMFVRTEPSQPGTWSWVSGGRQAYYRAPNYWRPGTTLTVRIGLGGHPTGGGRYGDQDRSATAKIGRSFIMRVDNRTKKMTVTQGGRVVRTMPVSLGKKSTPSSSGTMVVMEKKVSTVFDTFAELGPTKGYRTKIDYAQRLTWSGQYIHSAPWSVGNQGRNNVSHGCVNVSPANARWLFAKTMVGDPVTVKGTGDELVSGNGWTAWDVSWPEFAAGSALPVPDGSTTTGSSTGPQ